MRHDPLVLLRRVMRGFELLTRAVLSSRWDDQITVNGWHGLKEHQPLGSSNRMRRVVYAESRKLRLRVNGYKDYIEPASLAEVPAPIPALLQKINPEAGQKVAYSADLRV